MTSRTVVLLCVSVLFACGSDDGTDTGKSGFFVSGSTPEQGAVNATVTQAPEFRLSSLADPALCNESQFLFSGMDESGEFAFDVEFGLSFQEEGRTLLLTHSEPLLNGFWYAAMVLDKEEPCRDITGRPIAPFGVEFFVP